MGTRYKKAKYGEAFRVNLGKTTLKEVCCDCGCVHIWQFHHIKENVWDFAQFRDDRATGQLRRHNYGNLQQDGRLKIR